MPKGRVQNLARNSFSCLCLSGVAQVTLPLSYALLRQKLPSLSGLRTFHGALFVALSQDAGAIHF